MELDCIGGMTQNFLELSSDSDNDGGNENNYGYVGRSVYYLLGSTLEDTLAQGSQSQSTNTNNTKKSRAYSVSAIYVPALMTIFVSF